METNRKLEVIRSQTAKLIEAVEPRNEDGVRFTPEGRKEIIAKRRMAEFETMPTGTIDIFRFLPKTPEQLELEEGRSAKIATRVATGTFLAGFSTLAYQQFVYQSKVLALVAFIIFLVSLGAQTVRYEIRSDARKELRQLDLKRGITVPLAAQKAYNGIVKNARRIEEGNYPAEVVASARLSLEGVTNHMKLIGEHTAGGRVKSEPCQKLLKEVFRIASEMEAFIAVEKQEERKLAVAVRRELGPSSVESERADESIQRTQGLTF